MRAVRFLDPSGDVKLGRLDGEVIFDAGPAGPRGFVPTEEGWRTIADASGLAGEILRKGFPAGNGRGAGEYIRARRRRIGGVHAFVSGNFLFPFGEVVIAFGGKKILAQRKDDDANWRHAENGFHAPQGNRSSGAGKGFRAFQEMSWPVFFRDGTGGNRDHRGR